MRRLQIIKQNEHYSRNANKGRKAIVFEPGDWVWVHMRKERFPASRRTKLYPRGDGPFQVKARIGDNAYVLDLPGDYGVSATFNVADLSPFEFDDLDSRTSPFEQGGNNENKGGSATSPSTSAPSSSANPISDPLHNISGPLTRSRAKRMKDALATLITSTRTKEELKLQDFSYVVNVLILDEMG